MKKTDSRSRLMLVPELFGELGDGLIEVDEIFVVVCRRDNEFFVFRVDNHAFYLHFRCFGRIFYSARDFYVEIIEDIDAAEDSELGKHQNFEEFNCGFVVLKFPKRLR